MKIKIHSFGLAGALTVTSAYGAIAFMLKTWPYETLQFISSVYMIPHLENIIPYIKVTPANLFTSLSFHFITAYLLFCFIALFYNIFTSAINK